jgi:hypothetical protein
MSSPVSLSDFADFILKAGPARLTAVKNLLENMEYHPAKDFWKPLRERIVRFHADSIADKAFLDAVVLDVTDQKKKTKYPEAIRGYRKFLGRNQTQYFEPSRDVWHCSGLAVRINPELGLDLNGNKILLKLYFRNQPLTKPKVSLVLALMRIGLINPEAQKCRMGLLDVCKGKLYLEEDSPDDLRLLLEAEAGSFVHLWNSLDQRKSLKDSA